LVAQNQLSPLVHLLTVILVLESKIFVDTSLFNVYLINKERKKENVRYKKTYSKSLKFTIHII